MKLVDSLRCLVDSKDETWFVRKVSKEAVDALETMASEIKEWEADEAEIKRLRAALEKAIDRMLSSRKMAQEEAYEKAAKVAEANDDDCSHTSLIQEDRRRIAAAIRALKSSS